MSLCSCSLIGMVSSVVETGEATFFRSFERFFRKWPGRALPSTIDDVDCTFFVTT